MVLRILKEDLGKRKLCARFVLHSLTPEQREDSHILSRHYRDGRCRQKFFNKIITGDETWCFACDPETKWQSSEWRHSLGRRNWNSYVLPHQDYVDNFSDSQDVLHKQFVPEGKIVNVEFYKGAMDRLLKRIQRVRPAAFCSREFFCCTIMRLPTKLQVFGNFWPKKCYNPLSPAVLYRFISARLYSVPQVENKVKRTLLCEWCCWDTRSRNWWIKVQKEEFSAAFRKLHDSAKVCIYANGAYFEFKKIRYVSSSCFFD